MTFPVFHGITLAANSYIENLHVEVLSTDPVPVSAGRIWFNSTDKVFKYSSLDSGGAVVVRSFASVEALNAAIASLQEELDDTQAGAGLETDGSYVADNTTNYITNATSLKDADKKLDAQIKSVADSAGSLQNELDDTQAGAGLETDGSYVAPSGSNYLSSAVSLKDADSKLDAQMKVNSDNITDLDDRLSDVESSYVNKDGSVAMTGSLSMGTYTIENVGAPVNASDAATKGYVDDAIEALGSVFEYVGTVEGGASTGAAFDMSTLAQTDSGDYYKVITAGYFKVGSAGTPFYANVGDGLVFNLSGGVDKIDSTDSTVSGTSSYIAVTGSTDSGFVVDIDSAFKTRMSTAESDIDDLQTLTGNIVDGSGLEANGTYAAPIGTNYLNAATDLKDADVKLDAQVKSNADAISDAQDEIDEIETAVGLNSDGSFASFSATNYINSATSIKNASELLDTQVKTNADDIASLQEELDDTQAGAGLGSDGSYTADSTTNYLTAATSLKDADKKLDTQVKTNADNIASLQDELNDTQTGAGLETNGSYSANTSANYIAAATSLKDADNKLDAQIKTTTDNLSSLKTALNNTRYTYTAASAATTHTITHNLNTSLLGATLWIERDGVYRNDIAAMEQTSANVLTVTLTSAAKVKVIVQNLDQLA